MDLYGEGVFRDWAPCQFEATWDREFVCTVTGGGEVGACDNSWPGPFPDQCTLYGVLYTEYLLVYLGHLKRAIDHEQNTSLSSSEIIIEISAVRDLLGDNE